MSVIQRLSDDMINKIAAGEVVERPASVVKELVENAIDAGASHIEVSSIGGGLKQILVRDNGCGMTRDDALLALERHATSKLRTEEDLNNIMTLGFRGEALPSIASVSRLTLISRPKDVLAGTQITISGAPLECSEVAAPAGTTFIVEDLFYNTPARLKFMRSERTETQKIAEVVEHLALANPHIAFSLTQDDRSKLKTSGSGKLADTLLTVYGHQVAKNWISVNYEQNDITIKGLVSRPEMTKGTRGDEHFIVNGRYVYARSLQHALEEAYRQLIPTKRYPLAVLFIDLPIARIDANVHPAKTEVRIQNEGELHQALLYALRVALVQGEHSEVQISDPSADYRLAGNSLNRGGTPLQTSSFSIRGNQETLTDLKQISIGGLAGRSDIYQSNPVSSDLTEQGSYNHISVTQPTNDVLSKLRPIPVAINTEEIPEGDGIFPPFRVITQLAGTYILAQTALGWLIVDQHAAHERIIYQKLLADLATGSVHSQTLLQPQSLRIGASDESFYLENLESLENLGFVLEPFGERTLLLRAYPMLLGEASGEDALREIMDELRLTERKPTLAQLREKALVTLSCKSAIKANTWLPAQRMEDLIKQLSHTPFAATCPHGRPTYWLLDLDYLNKHFKRT